MTGYEVKCVVDVTYTDVITVFIPEEDYCQSHVDSVLEEEVENRLNRLPTEIDGFMIYGADYREM